MTGLPKKYAKMGFKKGWKLFKKTQTFKKSKLKIKTRSPRGRPKTMAKRRRVSRRKKQVQKGFLSKLGKPVGSMIYGAIRSRTSDFIANSAVGKMFPVSQVTDEALMLLAMFGVRKMGIAKSGVMRSVVNYGEAIEYARLGETFSDMFMNRKAIGGNNTQAF